MCIYDRGLEIFASFEFWVFFGLDSVVLSSNNLRCFFSKKEKKLRVRAKGKPCTQFWVFILVSNIVSETRWCNFKYNAQISVQFSMVIKV